MQQVAGVGRSLREKPTSDRAFTDLLKPLIEPGFRLALAMLHDPQAAEDAVQDASFVAWRKHGSLREPERLRSWFLGVVANQCRNARRGSWRARVTVGQPDDLTVVSSEDRAVRGADLRRAVASLGHDDRLVVTLYFYLDMALPEVAQVVGISESAARARLYRAIQKLRPGVNVEEALR